jgi:hypothetical protein
MNISDFFATDENYGNADRQFTTFTGVDMHVSFGPTEVGSVSALSVTVTRDTVPRYISGRVNAAAFAKGRRGIAGTMSWQVFDRDPILRDLYREIANDKTRLSNLWSKLQVNVGNESNLPGTSGSVITALNNIKAAAGAQIVEYIDQLPPVDVTISFVSETTGEVSVARLIGVVFLSAGMAWSMGDVDNEMATTYLARAYKPLTPVWADLTTPYYVAK